MGASASVDAGSGLGSWMVPARTAVLICDLQNDGVRGSGAFYADMKELVRQRRVIENSVRLTEGAREAGARIFFITVVRRPDYSEVANQVTDVGTLRTHVLAKHQVSLIEGSWGAQIVDELKPRPEDYVLVKKRRSAFYATELDFHLRTLGITTLVIGGVATHLGVENTVREAWDRDYNIVVVPDISASFPPTAHDYALSEVFPRMARVMDTDAVLSTLRKRATATAA